MVGIVVRRVAALVPVLVLVSVITFLLMRMVPGDPATLIAGEDATEERIEEIRRQLALDRPLFVQYLEWAGGAIRGDLGTSAYGSQPVTDAIRARLPATLSLALVATVIGLVGGALLGIVAGLRRGRIVDRLATVAATVGLSVPNFWFGLVLVSAFALERGWFPATGYVAFSESPAEWLHHLILPGIALSTALAAETTRLTRAGVGDVMQTDYVRTARAKGLSEWRIVTRHALKNASIPVVTVLGLQVARLLGGAVIVEAVFGLQGVGQLALQSVLRRDFPMIQGIILVTGVMVVVTNLLVDLSYSYLNPRGRES
jgi:peptide/nickel transport system permease protein